MSKREEKYNQYVEAITKDLEAHKQHNKRSIEKLASTFGITNKNLIKELTELAIVNIARSIASLDIPVNVKYMQIVDLYKNQVNLSHRTSESIRLQQYSTPAPIAFLAGVFSTTGEKPPYFEPSAGNGLLTIASPPENWIVNEVDDIRRRNLETQGYLKVLDKDASQPFENYYRYFSAVVTNPPFGTLPEPEVIGTYWTKILDHKMAVVALETMKNDGKAAIIIGGHTKWDTKGRIVKGKNRDFFLYLYRHYNVLDVINIDGHKLYSRQGTAFDVRLILIDGRKEKPEGYPPLKTSSDITVDTFEQLYERVIKYVPEQKDNYKFKIGDKVSFIGTGRVPKTGTIKYLSNNGWYEVKTGKHLFKISESELTPAIEYARKVKTGAGYKAFRKIQLNTRQEYEIKFIDSYFTLTVFASDRNDAIVKAILHRLEQRQKEKEINTDHQSRIRIAKAKLKLLMLMEKEDEGVNGVVKKINPDKATSTAVEKPLGVLGFS